MHRWPFSTFSTLSCSVCVAVAKNGQWFGNPNMIQGSHLAKWSLRRQNHRRLFEDVRRSERQPVRICPECCAVIIYPCTVKMCYISLKQCEKHVENHWEMRRSKSEGSLKIPGASGASGASRCWMGRWCASSPKRSLKGTTLLTKLARPASMG